MKKIIAVLLVGVLCLCLCACDQGAGEPTPTATDSPGQPTLTLGSETGKRGEEVTVAVNISAGTGICANDLTVTFNPRVLTYVSCKAGSAFAGGVADGNLIRDGVAQMTLATLTASENGGEWCTFTFQINPDAPFGKTPLVLGSPTCQDYDLNDIDVTLVDGSITIEE